MSKKIDISIIPDNALTELSGKFYDDIAHKSLIQIGDMSESLMKLVFLPFKCLGMTVDELEMKYKSFIEKTINKVPQNKLVEPDPIIAKQILDNVKFVFSENILVEMFSNLLASDMNIDSKNIVHPSFVEILSQMNSLDAQIILYMHYYGCLFESTLHFFIGPRNDVIAHERTFFDIPIDVPSIRQWYLSSNFLEKNGIIESSFERKIRYKKFRKYLKKYYEYNTIPKTIKRIFSINKKAKKVKTHSKLTSIQLLINSCDELTDLLQSIKIKDLRMEMFYEQCKGFFFTPYGSFFRMCCINQESEKYIPKLKQN